ncbi:hypothetical protein [Paenibacillus aceris]|uniref:Beta-hexosaminidase bacterial type N-terminal domain-containing protein n=1 Tax=Paenibacillus aceris TaxID=869555 RepID=A0ABS4HXA3_9BACL|nr:hypothetical protein [Paenibacillus aceris]MBP1963304.1 hypothetical protein [Paenibacillus aceris]NHW36190.1 hypothetical protein [Paenibacillus aceris]
MAKLLTQVVLGDEDLRYLQSSMLDETFYPNKRFFVIKEEHSYQGVTHLSEQLFERTKNRFGKFEAASINKEKYLVLTDENGNELHLTGCTSESTGTGLHGTLNILRKLNFDIDLELGSTE